ncbi:MAG: HlyD family efflux transporter periplasmic adaptor subunit [Hoeflea sp.]|uniref:HlyD family secretion protein n=1 Tax=Hoeflea sp. TaxID=1940281 RepID=UPI001D509EA7|nr:HlyD family efflux transporter periplasmic adaptor subunit [Hoeflea sp.]MBU4528826.1 HlyD family efflux transporter periplasmic adaptor subunit [Alphaproteobacteria bacterium]MBU4545847.1 HlyD family efflux transporter periplasmic adaptor subunit [Alphaproteobacteria bacterium]MBU4549960.1 HlyD family efflux transporter periplasmic adaptor subunit [Alphaproteobacteria bacterium]MBV1725957.1 HlyD family efflux transporter periplasmic adaptor subunit [Hoeflea sp.]MBV1762682.1 HlyD family effl
MTFLCSLPLLSALAFMCGGPGPLAVGYVEGEYVLVAPIETAQIVDLAVRRGDRVTAGQPLGRLERRDAEIAVAQAEAALTQAESQLANLQEGRRPEEIASIEAALSSAKAQAEEAGRVMQRHKDLLARGISTQATFDSASTSVELARAKVAELEANLAVARLPARANEIKAAQASVEQAKAVLDTAEWRLAKRTLLIPQSGVVSDIIRNTGEVAGPQAPVLSVLPDGALKLKLYVPEFALSSLSVGAQLTVRCDGCGEGMRATVSYISSDPEFTPPVIYSLETRQKLVYLIEARPEDGAWALAPGQIVDVALEGGEE